MTEPMSSPGHDTLSQVRTSKGNVMTDQKHTHAQYLANILKRLIENYPMYELPHNDITRVRAVQEANGHDTAVLWHQAATVLRNYEEAAAKAPPADLIDCIRDYIRKNTSLDEHNLSAENLARHLMEEGAKAAPAEDDGSKYFAPTNLDGTPGRQITRAEYDAIQKAVTDAQSSQVPSITPQLATCINAYLAMTRERESFRGSGFDTQELLQWLVDRKALKGDNGPLVKAVGQFLFNAVCAIDGSAPKTLLAEDFPAALEGLLKDIKDLVTRAKNGGIPEGYFPCGQSMTVDFLNCVHKHLGMYPRNIATNPDNIHTRFREIMGKLAELGIGPPFSPVDPDAVPSHALDAFIGSALKALGYNTEAPLPDKPRRLDNLQIILQNLSDLVPAVMSTQRERDALKEQLETIRASAPADGKQTDDLIKLILEWRSKLGLVPPLDGGKDLREDAVFRQHQISVLVQLTFSRIEAHEREGTAIKLLHRIRQWDMLDSAADGPFWKREIDRVVGTPAAEPTPRPEVGIAHYHCLNPSCREDNVRPFPLPDDATCNKCGLSLHGIEAPTEPIKPTGAFRIEGLQVEGNPISVRVNGFEYTLNKHEHLELVDGKIVKKSASTTPDGPLDEVDWLQLEHAARGAVSGIGNWPRLRSAIQKIVALKPWLVPHAGGNP